MTATDCPRFINIHQSNLPLFCLAGTIFKVLRKQGVRISADRKHERILLTLAVTNEVTSASVFFWISNDCCRAFIATKNLSSRKALWVVAITFWKTRQNSYFMLALDMTLYMTCSSRISCANKYQFLLISNGLACCSKIRFSSNQNFRYQIKAPALTY